MTENGPSIDRPELLIVKELREVRVLLETLHNETLLELRRLRDA